MSDVKGRRRERRPFTLDQLPLGAALRHPAVIAMVLGNLSILALSFTQL